MGAKISFESSSLILGNVPEHKRFFSRDGQVFQNLEELHAGLKKMDAQTFEFHVNKDKNDFSTWIYDCLGDANLAEVLRKSVDKTMFVKKIKARITYLKKNVNGGS